MKEPRPYHSPARQAAAAATRRALVEALASQLGRPGQTDFVMTEAAAAAGVSLRTAHLHLPDKRARVEAVAAWVEEALGEPVADPVSAAELPAFVRQAYARAARDLRLTRAIYTVGIGNEVRLARLAKRRAHIRRLLAEIGAPPADTRRAAAVICLLASSEAGIPLLDIHGLTISEAARAASDAVHAILEQLEARARVSQARARSVSGGAGARRRGG